MAKPNLSLSVYTALELLPIILFFAPLMVFGLSYMFGLMCCVLLNKRDSALAAVKKYGKGMTKLTMVVFGPPMGIVQYERHREEEVDHLDITVVYIHKRKVPRRVVFMLGAYTIGFIAFAISVFWDIFLLVQSSDCDDTTIDCFAINDTNSEPIHDCNIYEGYGSNVTISCYSFVYSFGPALGAIGGLFTMIKVIMKVISAIFLGLYGYAHDNKKLIWFFNLFQAFVVLFVPIGIPIGMVVIVIGFPSLSVANIAQIILAMFTLCIGFSIPWSYFTTPDSDDNANAEGNISESNEEESTPIIQSGRTPGHGTMHGTVQNT